MTLVWLRSAFSPLQLFLPVLPVLITSVYWLQLPKEKSQKGDFPCIKDTIIIFWTDVSLTSIYLAVTLGISEKSLTYPPSSAHVWLLHRSLSVIRLFLSWPSTPCDKVRPLSPEVYEVAWMPCSVTREQKGQWCSVAWKFSPKPGIKKPPMVLYDSIYVKCPE